MKDYDVQSSLKDYTGLFKKNISLIEGVTMEDYDLNQLLVTKICFEATLGVSSVTRTVDKHKNLI